MAGSRNRLRKSTRSGTSQKISQRSEDHTDVPQVFQELLEEEQASQRQDASVEEEVRPLKKRKIGRIYQGPGHDSIIEPSRHVARPVVRASAVPSRVKPEPGTEHELELQIRDVPWTSERADRLDTSDQLRVRQTVIETDESEESDMDWEDAMVNDDDDSSVGQIGQSDHSRQEIKDISIIIGPQNDAKGQATKTVRRRAITSVDKTKRLHIHKMHIMCLLYHIYKRNAWCNDQRVQAILRKIPSPRTLQLLISNPDLSQYQVSKQFTEALNDLKLMWSKRFTVTARGLHKPYWVEVGAVDRPASDFDELDMPMDRDDFRAASAVLEGSQDVGAQLFCALLRSIGMEARLVCSLQCLPFASAAQPPSAQKDKAVIVLDPYKTQNRTPSKAGSTSQSRNKRPSRLERALGERHPMLQAGGAPKQRKKYHTAYPVYWVEAFNTVHQKWIPVDPLSTYTVNAPEKLEPPLSFAQNSLAYAIAFDEDYTAKDVTRRYAKQYSAKTRKIRVESTPHGLQWWTRVLGFFARARQLDRDQVEDAVLDRKEAGEGIPNNVQDFKDHPVYVLERHLRHNEVIHPLNQVGKVNVGSSFNPKLEPIYRRKDVHITRSADKWYRMGRDVIDGEQPLKHAKPKKGRLPSVGPDMDIADIQEDVGAALYAEFQTELYIPPPVVRGRIPRNAYGNLDLYVPSMCPPGGVHIRHKLASKAARVLGVDFAEAVTGFNFKGRRGTAVVQGVVVAREYGEAVTAVIDGFLYAVEEAEEQQRRAESLRLWRRFYLGLRIAQRVNAIEIDGERGPVIDVQQELEKEEKHALEQEFAGGFFPDERADTERVPQAYVPSPRYAEVEGGFLEGGFEPEDPGGLDESEEEGGGFMQAKEEDDVAYGHNVGVPTLKHFESFGSAILDQQELRPHRTSSFDYDFSSSSDGEDSEKAEIEGESRAGDADSGKTAASRLADSTKEGCLDDVIAGEAHSSVNEATATEQNVNVGIPLARKLDTTTEGEATSNGSSVLLSEDLTRPSSSSPSATGSLLMEDPEDEDADPDWLIDAT